MITNNKVDSALMCRQGCGVFRLQQVSASFLFFMRSNNK